MEKINVDQWKEMFSEIGLSDEDMHKWHNIFEKKYPNSHQSFLEWLGLEKDTIKTIREECR